MSQDSYSPPRETAPAVSTPRARARRDRIARGEWYLECRACGSAFREEGEGWRTAARTGRCETCRCFFDPAVEAKVAEVLGDPATAQEANRARVSRLALGIVLLLAGAGILALNVFRISLWLIIGGMSVAGTGVSCIAFAFLWTPELEARNKLLSQTGVRKYATRMA